MKLRTGPPQTGQGVPQTPPHLERGARHRRGAPGLNQSGSIFGLLKKQRVSGGEMRSAVLLSARGTWEERRGELIQDLMEKSSVAQGDQSGVAF